MSSLWLLFNVPLYYKEGQQATDDLFNTTLLIQRMAAFSLGFPDLSMLPRSKRATSCCHLLSVWAVIKRDPIKSCFTKDTNLVITRHTNTKVHRAHFFLVPFTTLPRTEEKGQGGTKGKFFLCCFAKDFISFLSNGHRSWSFENG